MYTKTWCGYCRRAQRLLERKGVEFEVIDVTHDPEGEKEMIRLAGRWTVPQIFIGGNPIGGSSELAGLEAAGQLDAFLASEPAVNRHDSGA
jgi:glutaredoxin 3